MPATRVQPLRRAAVMVSDLDRSLSLYRDVLGLTVWKQGTAGDNPVFFDLLGVNPGQARFAILQARGSEVGMVGLFEVTGPRPALLGRGPGTGVNIGEVALVFPAERVTDTARAIQSMGLPIICPPRRFDVPGGGHALEMTFRDPDGALVNLIEWLAD
ncbi:MAG: VOC family protein [Gammaproteobacteria bacterium]